MAASRPERRRSRLLIALPVAITVMLATWFLRATYAITMPLVAGFFLAVLVYPLERGVRRALPKKLGFLGVALSAIVVIAAPVLVMGLFWLGFRLMADEFPTYVKRTQKFWSTLVEWGQEHDVPMHEGLNQAVSKLLDLLSTLLTSVWSVMGLLALFALIFFLAILMLLEVPAWRDKSFTALEAAQARTMVATVGAIAKKVRDYLLLHTFVSAVSAVTEGLWIWVLGVDFAFLWAMVIFAANYVPRIGSVLSFIPPTLVALIQHGLGRSVLTLAGLATLDTIIGYFVEPRLGARTLKVSPVVMLLSLMVWGWVWGVAGAILAVPLTVTAIVIFANIQTLRPLAMLLGQFPSERALEESTSAPPAEESEEPQSEDKPRENGGPNSADDEDVT